VKTSPPLAESRSASETWSADGSRVYNLSDGMNVIARTYGDGSHRRAKLAAAAPELGAATRDLLKAFRECIGAAAFWEFEQSNPAVRAAMAALAKAGL
jgi:hypothetical protein